MSSPEAQLWPLLNGALATRALALVVDLGVAEALADGPRPIADPLGRVVRALATAGVFAEDPPGTFRHTDASRLLLEPGWAELAHFHGGAWHRAAGELDASGEPAFPRAFGTDFWTWLAERPEERAAFDRAMVEGTGRRVDRLDSYAWRGDETVVDVGGGNGGAPARPARTPPRPARHRLRPARDGRGRPRRAVHLRRRELLRGGARR